MRKCIVLVVLIFISNTVFGQISEDLKKYYSNINEAELAIVDSNYMLATQKYAEAKHFRKTLYIKDRYNYSTTCALTKQYEICCKEIEYIISKGGHLITFQRNSAYNGFFKSSKGKGLVRKVGKIKPTYNLEYRRKLDSLVYLDQLFRVMPGGYGMYGDTIKRIDSLNVIAFNNLILKYGFPSEDIIGIDSIKFTRPVYDLLILHNRLGAKYRSFNFSAIMQKAMNEGWLEIHTAAEYVEISNGVYTWGIEEIRPVKCAFDSINANVCFGNDVKKPDYSNFPIGYFAMKPETEAKYNLNRMPYSLEPISEARRKAIYQLNDKRFDFSYSKLDILVFSKKLEYENVLKNIVYIKN